MNAFDFLPSGCGSHKMAVSKEVFLSYGREPEIVPFVQKLKLDLEATGISVWLDTDDIKAGSDWHGAIGTGLDECCALLCILSRKYIHSRYCTSELYTANADGKLIFPVLYDEINFSENERSRGVKYVVSGLNWTMMRPGKDEYQLAQEKLIKGMKDKGEQVARCAFMLLLSQVCEVRS